MKKISVFLGKIPFLIKRIFWIFLLVYLGFGITLFVLQSKYIYYPDKTDFQNCPSFKNADKIFFGSSRGYFTKRSQEKIIVFYSGNAGRACDRDYLDYFFAQQNYSTFFAEYSGYGEKGNNPSLSKILKNVEDTIDFLKTQEFKNIIVIGESIGAGPAAYHVSRANVNKLVLITAYNNLASVAFTHYPVYPTSLLLLHNFTPDKWLADYEGLVSIILAEKDKVIPNKLGQKLYLNIPSDLKKIYIVQDAGHNTIYEKKEFYTFLKLALE